MDDSLVRKLLSNTPFQRYLQRKWREIDQAKLHRFCTEELNGAEAPSPTAWTADSVAVVVPCYGHQRFLAKTFQSIVGQTRVPDEVILVEDRSPDGTLQELQRLISEVPPGIRGRFRLLSNEINRGQSRTLNRGVGVASSDVVLVLNDDDYLYHDVVEVSMQLFHLHPELAMIGGSCVPFSDEGALDATDKLITSRWSLKDIPLKTYPAKEVWSLRGINDLNMTNSGSSFKKKAWAHVGGYEGDKKKRVVPFSDRDFQLKMNCLFDMAVAYETPFSFWRTGSSVDAALNS